MLADIGVQDISCAVFSGYNALRGNVSIGTLCQKVDDGGASTTPNEQGFRKTIP